MAKKKSIKTELKRSEGFVATPLKEVPGYKTSFKKSGVTYKVGDRVIVTYIDTVCQGTITNVLGSQFTIHDEEHAPYGKFFFYQGSKLQKIN